ncbi:unnamed protein product [Sphagnum troendelagicum]|jgi:hypothetical protein
MNFAAIVQTRRGSKGGLVCRQLEFATESQHRTRDSVQAGSPVGCMQDFAGIWSGQVLRQPLDPLVMVARRTGYSCCVVNTTTRNQKRLPALYNAYECDGFLTQHQLILVHCRLLSFKIRDLFSQESIGSSVFSKEVCNSSSSVNIRKTRLFIERVLQLNRQIRGGRDSRLGVLERLR